MNIPVMDQSKSKSFSNSIFIGFVIHKVQLIRWRGHLVRLECGTDLEHKVINWDNLTRVVSCLGASSKMGDNFKTLEMSQ